MFYDMGNPSLNKNLAYFETTKKSPSHITVIGLNEKDT